MLPKNAPRSTVVATNLEKQKSRAITGSYLRSVCFWAWSEGASGALAITHCSHHLAEGVCDDIAWPASALGGNHCGQRVCGATGSTADGRCSRRLVKERSLTLSLILHELMVTHMKSLQTLCAATWRLQLPEPCTHGIGRTRLEQNTSEVVHMFHQLRLGQVSLWYPKLLSSVIAQSAATTSFPSEGSARTRNEFFY